MNKRYISFLFIIPIVYFLLIVKIESLQDFSDGSAGSVGSIGLGEWYTNYLGLKVSILNKNNEHEDTEIILNSSGTGGVYFSTNMKPKTKYTDYEYKNINWTKKKTTYTNNNLPSDWLNGDVQVNLYDLLSKKDYKLLKEILGKEHNKNKIFQTLSEGDYILIEPMVQIGDYYGTAFELLQEFGGDLSTCEKFFCYWYTRAVFGGDSWENGRGVLYNTLYVPKKITNIGLYNASAWVDAQSNKSTTFKNLKTFRKLNKCLASRSCGRGIGVFKYDDIYEIEQDPEPTCQTELSKLGDKPTAKQLVGLYLNFEKQNEKYNGLLNFENPTCSVIDCSKKATSSCLSASHGASNENMDFSCSTKKTTLDGLETTFCKKNFDIVPQVPIVDTIKAGMIFYNTTNKYIINSTLVESCYSSKQIDEKIVNFSSYTDIVSNISFDGKSFSKVLLDNDIIQKEIDNNNGYVYEKTTSYGHRFKKLYALLGSGKIVETSECTSNGGASKCRSLGYGFATNFSENNSQLQYDFSYTYEGKKYTDNSCIITVEPEIIKCTGVNNCKLNLEFHTIKSSMSETFLKKDGYEKRMPGSNWCTLLKNKVLEERNDSYNKKQEKPIYKITLTPDTISKIRNYNKQNKYDDFDFNYETSKFLQDTNIFKPQNFEKLSEEEQSEWYKGYKFKCGDMDLNGKLNVRDRTLLQKNIGNVESECQKIIFEVGDINSDMMIDGNDDKLLEDHFREPTNPKYRLNCTGENVINEG